MLEICLEPKPQAHLRAVRHLLHEDKAQYHCPTLCRLIASVSICASGEVDMATGPRQRLVGYILRYADRLLLQRLRKSQSGTALYKEAQVAEEQQERSVHCSFDSGTSQRLLVVANRLPVSAYRDKQGKWQLQVDQLPDEEVMFAHFALLGLLISLSSDCAFLAMVMWFN